MPHYFFFSYARANANDRYLEQFFNELSNRIREQEGLDPDEPVGFFDQPELKLGANWENELKNALQTCPVMVSMYSPAYFNSLYCGKEWEVFRRRQELFVKNLPADDGTVEYPPVIKPVIWIPLSRGQVAPEAVKDLQYYMGGPEADHNKIGLLRMRRRLNEYEKSYDNFIESLKEEILAAQKLNLPSLPDFNDLEQIESAFHPPAPVGPGNGNNQPQSPPVFVSSGGKGPQFVRFAFIAGRPGEFPKGVRAEEFYLNDGGGDWRPYLPDTSPIEYLAQMTALNAGFRISDRLQFGPTLPTEVRNAEGEGSLVVLFVDCWTAELPTYQPILQNFDENSYFNCSIFIPFNDKDPQTFARRDALLELVRTSVFKRWSLYANTGLPFFRDSIQTINQLEDELKGALRQLQTQIGKGLMDRATKDSIPRRIESDITQPIMAHK